jgi:hypothetical protein
LVDEMADQMVCDLAEVICGGDRLGELVEWVGARLVDGRDQVGERGHRGMPLVACRSWHAARGLGAGWWSCPTATGA